MHRKEAKEQYNIFTTVSQRRYRDWNRIQSIIEIFPETTFTDCFTHIYISCSHYAHICFKDFLPPHTNIFASFQYPQKARLRRQRQFTNFIQKYRTLISYTKISFTLSDSPGERSFFMTKELTIYRSFRNRSTVNRKIFLTATRGIIMYHPWKNLLSDTTFADNKNTKVSRSHLKGYIQRMIQRIAVSHDVVSLLYIL